MENNTPLTPEEEIKYWAKLYQDVMEENGQNVAALNYWRGEGRIDAKVDSRLKEKDDRIAELERENFDFVTVNNALHEIDDESHQLNKTLMGLLEQWFRLRTAAKFVPAIPIFHAYVDEAWQSYCKEHNLKIDTDGK